MAGVAVIANLIRLLGLRSATVAVEVVVADLLMADLLDTADFTVVGKLN